MNARTSLFECYIKIVIDTFVTIMTFTFLLYFMFFLIFVIFTPLFTITNKTNTNFHRFSRYRKLLLKPFLKSKKDRTWSSHLVSEWGQVSWCHIVIRYSLDTTKSFISSFSMISSTVSPDVLIYQHNQTSSTNQPASKHMVKWPTGIKCTVQHYVQPVAISPN